MGRRREDLALCARIVLQCGRGLADLADGEVEEGLGITRGMLGK